MSINAHVGYSDHKQTVFLSINTHVGYPNKNISLSKNKLPYISYSTCWNSQFVYIQPNPLLTFDIVQRIFCWILPRQCKLTYILVIIMSYCSWLWSVFFFLIWNLFSVFCVPLFMFYFRTLRGTASHYRFYINEHSSYFKQPTHSY